MTTLTPPTLRTDRDGFPLTHCARCNGTGTFSRSRVENGRCFACGGKGLSHEPGKIAEAAAALSSARRDATRATATTLAPGDVIRWAEAWREVATTLPHQTDTYAVTFTDDTSALLPAHATLTRRAETIDPAPYLRDAGLA